jgi:hypothetical protein
MLFPCIAAVPTQPSPRPLRATRWPAMRSDGVRSFRMAVVSRKSRRWVQARKYRSDEILRSINRPFNCGLLSSCSADVLSREQPATSAAVARRAHLLFAIAPVGVSVGPE